MTIGDWDLTLLDRGGIRVEEAEGIVTVVLDRPDSRNAQTPATWVALADVGTRIAEAGEAIVGVILTGAGPGFSSGLDRRMFTPEGIPGEPSLFGLAALDDAEMDRFITAAQAAFTWWREVPAVTIAAVHGFAVGAGFQLALGCDLIVADPAARFAMRETSWGLVPDLGGTDALLAGAGYSAALEACATGRWIPSAELHAWGLALPPHEDPRGRAGEILAAIGATPPGSVADLKRLLGRAGLERREAQLAREREIQRDRLRSLARLAGGA